MKTNLATRILLVLLLPVLTVAQNAGQFDLSFNATGYYSNNFGFHDNLTHILVQPDQKSVSTGTALTAAYAGVLKVMRLNADGSPDNGFADAGVFTYATPDAETYGVISQLTEEGKILVGGISINTTTYYADILLLRLNPDGTPDATFGTNGVSLTSITPQDDFLQGMAIQPDGRIVVSGTVSETVGFDLFNAPCILRFTADGQPDPSFGTGGIVKFPAVAADNELTSCLVQPDGKILASGHYQAVFTGATDFDILLVRVDGNGAPDPLFGTGGMVVTPVFDGIDDAFGMDLDPSGNIYLGGFTTMPVSLELDMILMKFDGNGVPVSSFGTDGVVFFNNGVYDVANDLKLQADHKIVLCGASGGGLFEPRSLALWRYLPDGTPDPEFGTNGFSATEVIPGNMHEFNSLALQQDNRIVAAGKYQANPDNDIVVARYMPGVVLRIADSQACPFTITPNPSNGPVKIATGTAGGPSVLTIYDIHGRTVFRQEFTGSSVSIAPQLVPGIYICEVRTPSRVLTGKLTVTE